NEEDMAAGGFDGGADAVEGAVEDLLGFDGLGQAADGAHAQAAEIFLLGGDDLDGDVAGGGIILKAVEDMPAVDVGEVDIEGDGAGFEFARHADGGGPAGGDGGFEAV